jgi:NTP pyrophosphatase (non-canonical NTP hydrolase)
MQAQDRVACFCDEHDLDAAKSAEYGAAPEDLAVTEDELGDALFALLATAEALDIDAEAALAPTAGTGRRWTDSSNPRG